MLHGVSLLVLSALCLCVLAALSFMAVLSRGSSCLLWAMFRLEPECGEF